MGDWVRRGSDDERGWRGSGCWFWGAEKYCKLWQLHALAEIQSQVRIKRVLLFLVRCGSQYPAEEIIVGGVGMQVMITVGHSAHL